MYNPCASAWHIKPFMVQPQFICNDNSTIWPHLWFFHGNVNFEGGSPNYPCIFRAQLTSQATDGRFSVFKAKVLSWRVVGFWPLGLGVQETFAHPRQWGLVLLGEVSIDCPRCLGPLPWPAWQELMGRLVPADRTALNREGSVQTLQRVFLASAFLASSLLDGLSPGSAVVTPSPLWGLSGPPGVF